MRPSQSCQKQFLCCVPIVARLAKAVGMTVYGLVRTMPADSEKSINVDEYRSVGYAINY